MLAIRCQFLQGTYQASPPGRLSESEWPPHPGRLHSALIASGWAWGGDSFPDEAADALAWLETQEAPLILMPRHGANERSSPTTFVPRNLSHREVSALAGHLRAGRDSAFQRDSGRVSRVFPTRVVGDAPIWFVWPDACPDTARSEALERLAGELQYLGSSRSPVLGMAFASNDGEEPWYGDADGEPALRVLLPTKLGDGECDLRVPYPGLTATLIADRAGGAGTRLGRTVAYRARPYPTREGLGPGATRDQVIQADSSDVTPPRSGPFATLTVRRARGFGLTLSHTTTLTEALRSACLAAAGDEAPALLHGHGDHPHAAFLALPNIGARHSDGRVLGLAVAIPALASENEREAIRSALANVELLNIGGGQLQWRLEDVDPGETPRALQVQRWTAPARRWSTATPMVLDRYPKPARGFSLEDAVKLSFRNALLPEPEEVEVTPGPVLQGSVSPASHSRPARMGGATMHATVTFPVPVAGPVLAGKGRYLGLGLFAPHPYEAERDPRRDRR